MRKITKILVAATLAFAMTFGAGMVTQMKITGEADGRSSDVITVVSPAQKSVVSADNEVIAEFFAKYKENYSKEFYGKGDNLPMNDIKLEWTCEDGKYYSVYVDESPDFSSAEIYTTVKPELSLGYLIPGDYYWKVKVRKNSGETVTSKVYNFKMQASVRSVKIDGVSNVRDLGGSVTTDGKTVKYGILYRSAVLDRVTENGKMQARRLGIKTDLDLRGDFSRVSPLGENVKRINYSAPWYVNEKDGSGVESGLNGDKKYVEAFANEIRTCADPDNYPMLFHCSIGRDRTGTLAAMLLAICGVEKKDIIREYELSWLSEIACNNPYIQVGAIKKFCYFIEAHEGDTFADKATTYLLSIGVTQAEIDSIKSILLG